MNGNLQIRYAREQRNVEEEPREPHAAEKKKTEKKEMICTGYKVVSVFDVSQTEGRELTSIGVNELPREINLDGFWKETTKERQGHRVTHFLVGTSISPLKGTFATVLNRTVDDSSSLLIVTCSNEQAYCFLRQENYSASIWFAM